MLKPQAVISEVANRDLGGCKRDLGGCKTLADSIEGSLKNPSIIPIKGYIKKNAASPLTLAGKRSLSRAERTPDYRDGNSLRERFLLPIKGDFWEQGIQPELSESPHPNKTPFLSAKA